MLDSPALPIMIRPEELDISVMNAHGGAVIEQVSEQAGRGSALHDRPAASPDRPTLGETLGETVPLISAPAFFGPPVMLLLGPWLLLVLLLIPPAALVITLAVVFLLGAGLLVALGALIASPYLLVRHLRARHPAAPKHLPFQELRAAGTGVTSR